jgi:uncharacterized membrane protein YtjA (UPF0391 family)
VTNNHRVVSRSEGTSERRLPWLGIVAGIAATLAPKCPLCLAAYLSMLGIGVGLAWIAPMLFPLGIAVAAVALVSLVKSRRRNEEWKER